jgi:hypothetical protein
MNPRSKTPLALEFAALATGLAILAPAVYAAIEPAVAQAVSPATDEVIVTLTVDAGISITSPADEAMSQNLGVSANSAVGDTFWNVKTNNTTGYTLSVKATTSPAMRNGTNSINDYTPAVVGTPETWSVPSGTAEFGFSAFGTHVDTGSWGTDSDCIAGANVPSAALKYRDFDTSDIQIASSTATTTTTGVDATVCFAVEQDTFYVPSGTYQATIIATAATQ